MNDDGPRFRNLRRKDRTPNPRAVPRKDEFLIYGIFIGLGIVAFAILVAFII